MKKILAGLMAAAVVAGVAYADGTTYSQNAVGFVSIEAEAGEMVPLSVPFVRVNSDQDGGLMEFDDLQFATDAPDRSRAYFWNGMGWDIATKDGDPGDPFEAGHPLKTGELFFFQPSEKMTVVIAGQVPSDPVMDVEIQEGKLLSAVGNPYPVPLDLENSELGLNATDRSTFWYWDPTRGWQGNSKDGDPGDPFEGAGEIAPGKGVFFQGAADSKINNWAVEKGYSWP